MSNDAPRSELSVSLPDITVHDPRSFIEALATALEATVPGIGLHFHDPEHGIEVALESGGRHRLSYRLRHSGRTLGEVTLRSRNRFDRDAIDRIEDILARALPALAERLAAAPSDAASDIDPD